ncbi:MAG: hypothetical protein JSW27_00570 [Phycisphaerales bacterium]|nr:MAG: hypothetical protein JSW27_00570 [Phycisphaerales bacterium]
MKKTSTYGLTLDQMASLFSMGREDPNPGDEKSGQLEMSSLLRKQLTCCLPRGTLFCDVLVMMMGQQGCEINSLTGKSLGDIFLSKKTSIALLQVIKESAKTLSTTLDSPAETALATTLYFAALASALVFHDRKITQNSYAKLDESFALLIEKQWMADELVTLFSQARGICQSRRSKP